MEELNSIYFFMNYEKSEPEIIWTDTETEQESVKMKWRKIRLREKATRLLSRNYQTLIEEVTSIPSKHLLLFIHL